MGLTQNKEYYYSSNSNEKIEILNKELLLLYLPYKNIEMHENEFVSLALNFKKQENQKINITYILQSSIDEILDEEISEEQCLNIISNLTDILDFYIYKDIAQNPPTIEGYPPDYHHRRVNLIQEINDISPKNRTFYEFFQDVQRILTVPRDLHFNIEAYQTKKGYVIYYYMAFLPLTFEIREYNKEQRIFINKSKYFNIFDEDVKQFIESHLDIPIKRINDLDPFDFIQNWSLFRSCKNIHSQFTYAINNIWFFYLSQYPFNFTDLINDYEFEDNQIKRISYLISKPKTNLQTSNNGFNEEEFKTYFLNTMEKYNFLIKPPIDEIKENFLIEKGLKKN